MIWPHAIGLNAAPLWELESGRDSHLEVGYRKYYDADAENGLRYGTLVARAMRGRKVSHEAERYCRALDLFSARTNRGGRIPISPVNLSASDHWSLTYFEVYRRLYDDPFAMRAMARRM